MSNFATREKYRQANLQDDVLFIYRQMEHFANVQGNIYDIPFDPNSALETIMNVCANGVAVVGQHSCAGAMLHPFPINKKAIVAQCVFYYFTKPREMGIIEELGRLCKLVGATHINAASLYPNNTILRYYSKIGLHPCEIQSIGPL